MSVSKHSELKAAHLRFTKAIADRLHDAVPEMRRSVSIMSDRLKDQINKNFGTHFGDNILLTYKQYMQKNEFKQLPVEHQEMFKYLLEDLERLLNK